jgi:N-acetylneuraminic acid mutarotase
MFDAMLDSLEGELRAALNSAVMELVATARTRLKAAVAEVAEERAHGLAEVAIERAAASAEVDTSREELSREGEAMQTHQEKQQGHVELNIGGYRYETSVQTLRRVPHTFFDAYFSGRYAQDVCTDGSIFVDRDGEHFGHILEYMRVGIVSVAEPGAHPSVSLLRTLKREFGFYCIELVVEQAEGLEETEMVYILGGRRNIERYDAILGQWTVIASPMTTGRYACGVCVVASEIFVVGGCGDGMVPIASMETYSPLSDSWSTLSPMPIARSHHATVAVGSGIYVLGGLEGPNNYVTASMLHFNIVQDTWSQVAPMPARRDSIAACVLGTDIYVFGGDDEHEIAQTSVFKFDTETNEWSTVPAPMPLASTGHSAIALGGLVYIVGAGADNREVLSFNPASGAWNTLASTSFCRMYGSSFVMGGCLYAAGSWPDIISQVERYDVTTDTWMADASLIEGRNMCCAVTIGSVGPADEQNLFDSLIAIANRHNLP